MEDRNGLELLAIFAAGALIGVGATLLIRPQSAFPRPVLRRLKESGRELRRKGRRVAHDVEGSTGKLAKASRHMLDQFRGEAREIVGAAREELAREVYEQLRPERAGRRPRHGHRHNH